MLVSQHPQLNPRCRRRDAPNPCNHCLYARPNDRGKMSYLPATPGALGCRNLTYHPRSVTIIVHEECSLKVPTTRLAPEIIKYSYLQIGADLLADISQLGIRTLTGVLHSYPLLFSAGFLEHRTSSAFLPTLAPPMAARPGNLSSSYTTLCWTG